MSNEGLGCCICVHDDYQFLGLVIEACKTVADVYVFVSRLAWNGTEGDWRRTVEVAKAAGAKVIEGLWPNESLHRRHARKTMLSEGFGYCLVIDGDEVVERKLLDKLAAIAREGIADRVHAH